jgi:hypothetical protein
MADQKLVSYVKSSLAAGKPPASIRLELYQAGWPKKDIEDAFASVRAGRARPAAPRTAPPSAGPAKDEMAGRPKSRKIAYVAVIAVILLGVGVLTYSTVLSIIMPPDQPIITIQNDTCGDGNCTGQETYELCPADCQGPPANMDLKISLNPASRPVVSGENASFDVEIASVSNLYGFQFDLEYDSAILQFSSASEGSFLSKNGQDSTFCVQPKASSRGSADYVTIACTRLGAIGGVAGSGVLESVIFTAKGSGTAQPNLANIKLVDSSARRIEIQS